MASIFSRIINGEIPCYKIAESVEFFAFLDINPLAPGHALVVPKLEEDYIFNLDDALLARMIVFAKKIALAIEASVDCKRIGVAVIGLEVPHVHIHLVPLNVMDDINFSRAKLNLQKEVMEDIKNRIVAKLG
jgi:histidine triad (HIT) family protein